MSVLINESFANETSKLWAKAGIRVVSCSNISANAVVPLSPTSVNILTTPTFSSSIPGTFVLSSTFYYNTTNVPSSFIPVIALNGTNVVSNIFMNTAPTTPGLGGNAGNMHNDYYFTNTLGTSYSLVFSISQSSSSAVANANVSYSLLFFPA